jgi:hypothetical protein
MVFSRFGFQEISCFFFSMSKCFGFLLLEPNIEQLCNCKDELYLNHYTLLFNYRMLDILEKFLIRKGHCFSRFDGSTPMNTRQELVDEFNKSPSIQVAYLSVFG